MARRIIHVDLDAFFSSVEEMLHPELRGRPIIVGARPEERGVVSSASYAARAYGVRSAMPVARALRLCPQAIVVPPRHGVYAEHSRRVMTILGEYTPLLEQLSVDEAFLDVTGCERLHGPIPNLARRIQERLESECGLPASLGVASSKLVAKIACDTGKPHGLVVVPEGEEQVFLAPLAIERLWGVGAVTGQRLRGLGIRTIGDLARWSEERLVARFGEQGRYLYGAARGMDRSPVQPRRARRSLSKECTFARDVDDMDVLRNALLQMSEEVATRLREVHSVAQTVRIKLRYADFSTVTRQTTLQGPTEQGQRVYAEALTLLERYWERTRPLRLLGVGVSGLLNHGGYQLGLLEDDELRAARLNVALDEIRHRFGRGAIRRGALPRGQPPGYVYEDTE